MPDKRQLVLDDLAVRIALAKEDGGIAQSDHIAEEILVQHPDCGMTPSDIAKEIVRLAGGVGVAVEIGDGGKPRTQNERLQ